MKTFAIVGGSIIVAGCLALAIGLKRKAERDGIETLKRDPNQVVMETFERQDEIQKAMRELFNS